LNGNPAQNIPQSSILILCGHARNKHFLRQPRYG